MRLIFAGTPEFAAVALRALLAAGHDVPLVLTQPDRPAGRGMKLQPSPVKQLALAQGLAVYQPATLRDPALQAPLAELAADAMVVAAYGLILPQAVLDLPQYGCLNIHASLLPRWRGAAPIQRALLAGDTHTGVAIMQMEAGLDTGPVIDSATYAIPPTASSGEVHDALAELGAELLVRLLAAPPQGGQDGKGARGVRSVRSVRYPAVAQASEGVTYAAKIEKAEARLDWQQAAVGVLRQVHAYNPFPGAMTSRDGLSIKVWQAALATPPLADAQVAPGTVLEVTRTGIHVACGEGAVCLQTLQAAGGRRLEAAAFLAGHPLQPGDRFECPALESK